MKWMTKHFNERQRDEIDFSRVYANDYAHGTDGHNAKMIIAGMAALLNDIEQAANNIVVTDADTVESIKNILGIE